MKIVLQSREMTGDLKIDERERERERERRQPYEETYIFIYVKI